MSKQQLVSEPLDEATVANLDRLALEWGCTREHIVATAVLRFLSEERRYWPSEFGELPSYVETDPLAIALSEAQAKHHDAFDAFVKVGEDAIERGEVYTHEEVMTYLRARYGSRKDAA